MQWKTIRVTILKGGIWELQLAHDLAANFESLIIQNSQDLFEISVPGLFSLPFEIDPVGRPKTKVKEIRDSNNWFDNQFGSDDVDFLNFSTSGFSYTWEARYSVVSDYLEKVNFITGRKSKLSMQALKKHWLQRLVLPFELCGDLTNQEYAKLIEKLPPDSPIQIQAKAVRHYPQRFLASHVLGYVGSGYEANPGTLSGSDLATFELQGRTGKAGVEKTFDHHLRGKDGGDIWLVNPMGSKFERVERQPSEKGKSLVLSIDMDLQTIAENSVDQMVTKLPVSVGCLIMTGLEL